MKQKLALILALFAFTLAGHADPYFPGSWYATKQIPLKQGGAVEVFFYHDHTMLIDLYLGSTFLESIEATFVESVKFFTFSFYDSDGWLWTGKMNKFTGQVIGTYHSPARNILGKFQCFQSDDGN